MNVVDIFVDKNRVMSNEDDKNVDVKKKYTMEKEEEENHHHHHNNNNNNNVVEVKVVKNGCKKLGGYNPPEKGFNYY